MRKKRIFFRIVSVLLCLGFSGLCAAGLLNNIVVSTTRDRILSPQEAAQLSDVDCILVLGCLVKNNGVPSDMLSDRLRRGVELHELGASE